MKTIFNKLNFISKLNNFNENLEETERILNKVNIRNSFINSNNYVSMKIDVKCNAFDVNEDKQRQCYKQFKCFWPKCGYSAKYQSLNPATLRSKKN